jgi:hypothetical protein
MKLKDLKVGGYYWTRCTRYENSRPVRVVQIVEVPKHAGWDRLVVGTTKKVQVHRLRLGDDGCLAAGRDEELMPGQVTSPANHEQVLARLVATKATFDANKKVYRLAEEYGPAMIEALEAAGFAGAVRVYKGLLFNRAAVAAWAEASFGADGGEA